MNELTWAFAGKIAVTVILGVALGSAVVAYLIKLYDEYLDSQDARLWNPDDCEDDEIVDTDDSEHTRVVREAAAQ